MKIDLFWYYFYKLMLFNLCFVDISYELLYVYVYICIY